jgi:hypothetical protein
LAPGLKTNTISRLASRADRIIPEALQSGKVFTSVESRHVALLHLDRRGRRRAADQATQKQYAQEPDMSTGSREQ